MRVLRLSKQDYQIQYFLAFDAVYSGNIYRFRSTYCLPPAHLEAGDRNLLRDFSRLIFLPDHSVSDNILGPLRLRVTLVH